MEDVMGLIKNAISNFVTKENGIPQEKQQQTIDVAAEAVKNGFKQNLSLDNIGNITSLFKSNENATSNPIVTNTITNVVNSLVQKVGLSSEISNGIATKIVPAIVTVFSGKVNDSSNKMNVSSLVESFLGNKNSSDGSDNGNSSLLDSIGKLFGK
jgi:hypothetical protein